jgi:hypothetical protein
VLRKLKIICLAFLSFMLFSSLNTTAAINDSLTRNLAPITGYVVLPAGNEFIIDLDASQGISVGDVFSVITEGESISHPVTKKVIGKLDLVKGYLQVTIVKQGYSLCKVVGPGTGIKRGDEIRRYHQVKAEFWDYTGSGEPIYQDLLKGLPQLQWNNYASSQKNRPGIPVLPVSNIPSLYFILNKSGLEVRAPDFTVVHSYSGLTKIVENANQSLSSDAHLIGLDKASGSSGISVSTTDVNKNKIWTSPVLIGTPVGIAVGDFDGDGLLEVAIAFTDRVEIGRITDGKYLRLESVELSSGINPYALDGVDLNSDGRMELYLSAASNYSALSGVMIEYVNGHYLITNRNIPWHMRRINIQGEGGVLLGQKMGPLGREFGGPVFRLRLQGGRLVEGGVYEVPRKVNLFGFTPLANTGSRKLFAVIGDDSYLKIITSENEELASSVDTVGGSESNFEMRNAGQGDEDGRQVYLKARLEQNEKGEIVVPANSILSSVLKTKVFSKSNIKSFVWDGSALKEAWQTNPEKSSLIDFCFADAGNEGKRKLVTVVAFPDFNPFSSRKSVLHMYLLP